MVMMTMMLSLSNVVKWFCLILCQSYRSGQQLFYFTRTLLASCNSNVLSKVGRTITLTNSRGWANRVCAPPDTTHVIAKHKRKPATFHLPRPTIQYFEFDRESTFPDFPGKQQQLWYRCKRQTEELQVCYATSDPKLSSRCIGCSTAVHRRTLARSPTLPTFQVAEDFALPAATASFSLRFTAPLLAAEHFRFLDLPATGGYVSGDLEHSTRLETFLLIKSYSDIRLIWHFLWNSLPSAVLNCDTHTLSLCFQIQT